MGWMADECPRCHSTKGFIRREKYGVQTRLNGESEELWRKKKVAVCVNCGRCSDRKDIIKKFAD